MNANSKINRESVMDPHQCLIESFQQIGIKSPNSTALASDDEIISYGKLHQLTDALAYELQQHGVGPESIVALAFERSFELVITILAVLKSGAAYLPLDINAPYERLEFVIDDASPILILTNKELKQTFAPLQIISYEVDWRLIDPRKATLFTQIKLPADRLAYVIYTSGSTGKPKGCLLQHGTLRNRIAWMQNSYPISIKDAVLQKTPCTFDVSVWEFVWPLVTGARLVLAKPGGHRDPDYLHRCIRSHMVTVCHFVPSMFRHFLARLKPEKLVSVRHIFLSGEILPYDLMKAALKKLVGTKLHNLYGPTEATIDVTAWTCKLRNDSIVPIGKAIDNVEIFLLNDTLEEVPSGEKGEICIAGNALARAYLNRPELTSKAFVTVQNIGKRVYKTGDLGQWLNDGELQYLGRKDNQIKLRGFRIELGEIENCLQQHNKIDHAIVSMDTKSSEDPKLIAFYKTVDNQPLDNIRQFLLRKLPDYMVPNKFIAVEYLPVTIHGKVDRVALMALSDNVTDTNNPPKSQPVTPLESTTASAENITADIPTTSNQINDKIEYQVLLQELLEISKDILDIPNLNPSSDFLDLGATSFTLLRLGQTIDAHFDVNIPVDVFLGNPSVNGLMEYLVGEGIATLSQSVLVDNSKYPTDLTKASLTTSNPITLDTNTTTASTTTQKDTSHFDIDTIRQEVLNIARDVLDDPQLSINDDFLERGATSFTLLHLGQTLDTHYEVNIPVDVFLASPSVDGLVKFIKQQIPEHFETQPIIPNKTSQTAKPTQIKPESNDNNQQAITKDPYIQEQDVLSTNTRVQLPSPKETVSEPASFRSLSPSSQLSRKNFENLLALLSVQKIDKKKRYLFASGGGKYPIQVYFYIAKSAIDGLNSGFFYYHPEKYKLIKLTESFSNLQNKDVELLHRSPVTMFLWAQLKSLESTYLKASSLLASLDAAYLVQALNERESETGISLSPAALNAPQAFSDVFELDNGHHLAACLHLGIHSLKNNQSSPQLHTNLCLDSFLPGDIQPIKLTEQEQKYYSENSLHLRHDLLDRESVTFQLQSLHPDAWRTRSCQRNYLHKKVTQQQLAQLLANVKHIYPLSQLPGTRFYLAIAEHGIENVSSGIYRFYPETQELQLLQGGSINALRQCFYPFNRKHYDQCGFVFIQTASAAQIADINALDLAITAAGRLGQCFLQHQSKLDIGLCPMGGLNLKPILDLLELQQDDQFIHGFIGGAWKHSQHFPDQVLVPQYINKSHHQANSIESLAIIGAYGHFADISNPNTFWQTLENGKSAYQPLAQERLSHWGKTKSNKIPVGGFMKHIDHFDHLHFGIAPIEARAMDPQERLLLQVVWQCLEDAGYTPEGLQQDKIKVGVYIGAMWGDYQHVAESSDISGDEILASAALSSLANSISHQFGFTGPSLAVDTGCASSLTALHLADQALRANACDVAVVGGVSLLAHPYHQRLLNRSQLLSPDNQCHVLGADANGWVLGEGVGAILIKPSKIARAEGDSIRAEILASCSQHRGKTRGRGTPAPEQQSTIISRLFDQAGLNAKDIQYVECAATGAGLADAAEWRSLQMILERDLDAHWYAGTIKPNIGHLESASGLSQLFKVIAQIEHKCLAPTLTEGARNPLITMNDSLQLVDSKKVWTVKPSDLRRAMINNYSAEGVCAHLLVQESSSPNLLVDEEQPQLIALSAHNKQQLQDKAKALLEVLPTSNRVCDLAYTLQLGRQPMSERFVVVAKTFEQVCAGLQRFLTQETTNHIIIECNDELEVNGIDISTLAKAWVNLAKVDWNQLHTNLRQRVPLPVHPFTKYRHWVIKHKDILVDTEVEQQFINTTVEVGSGSIDTPKLPEIPQELTTNIVANWLKTLYAQISDLDPNHIDKTKNFEEIGLSSLLVTRLTEKLHDLGLKSLRQSIWFEFSNLEQVAAYLLETQETLLNNLLLSDAEKKQVPLKKDTQIAKKEQTDNNSIKLPRRTREAGAIIGVACRLPDAETPQEFWKNISTGKCSIRCVPDSRSDLLSAFTRKPGLNAASYTDKAAMVQDVDAFDPLFFGISPAEACTIDPQERLFLQIAWSAIEDAGIAPTTLADLGNVGVFVGVMNDSFERKVAETGDNQGTECQPQVTRYWSVANRVSYILNLKGPSLTVDTACSSSLSALHIAMRSLRDGECDFAIVGGSNLILHASNFVARSMLGMLSPNGECKPFSEKADGTVVSEGVVAFLLTRESLAQHYPVKGVVLGSAINSGGKTNGYTVPNPKAQADLIRNALDDAGIEAESVSCIEAHGTGTALGDTIEFDGLCAAYGSSHRSGQCSLGSVKSNIGHTEATAGAASLLKVILQFQHQHLAPSLGALERNNKLDWKGSPFRLQTELEAWPVESIKSSTGNSVIQPRRAGISSFGAGGTNVHIIVQEPETNQQSDVINQQYIFILSAASNKQLHTYTTLLHTFLLDNPNLRLSDIAFTLQVGRQAMKNRLAITTSDRDVLLEALNYYSQQKPHDALASSDNSDNKSTLSLIDEDDIKQLLNSWLTSSQVEKVASLWLQGYSVPWQRLYQHQPSRISLPTYPFLRQNIPLPLLNSKKTTSIGPTTENQTITLPASHPWLSEHIVHGNRVLPASATIALLWQTLKTAGLKPIGTLLAVQWLHPVIVTNKQLHLQITLDKQTERYHFTIRVPNDSQSSNPNIQGYLQFEPAVSTESIDLPSILTRCPDDLAIDNFYHSVAKLGIEYGTSFQRLSHIYVGDNEAILVLKQKVLNEEEVTYLIDAGLHGAVAAFVINDRHLWLPVFAGKIIVHDMTLMCSHVHIMRGHCSDNKVSLNLVFCSAEGQVIARIEEAKFQRRFKVESKTSDEFKPHLAISSMIPQSLNVPQKNLVKLDNFWVCVDDDNLSSEYIKNLFTDRSVIVLREASNFEQRDNGDIYLSLVQKTHIEQLQQIHTWPDAIIRLGSFGDNNINHQTIELELQHHFYSWIQLVKSYATTNSIHLNLCSVLIGQIDYSLAHATDPLFKVISTEYPNINCALIQVDQINETLVKNIEQELCNNKPQFTRTIAHHRQTKQYQLVTPSSLINIDIKGVIVISGGSGMIGQSLARHFLTTQSCSIALLGRQPQMPISLTSLFEQESARVKYFSVDVADESHLADILDQVRDELGPIVGIIHAAGILRDALITNKNPADMAEVLAAKVFGLSALNKLTCKDNLRFFLALSSLTTVIGIPGQADYAFANSAMEQLIGLREQARAQSECRGNSIAVSLPYITGGGMTVDKELLQRVIATTKVQPLPLDDVPEVIEHALRQLSSNHYLVLPGKRAHIEQLLIEMSPSTFAQPRNNPPKQAHTELNSNELRSRTENYLIQSVANILQVDPELINTDSELSEFGFDSVLLTRWATKLSEELNSDISPTQFFSNYTIDSICELLIQEYRSQLTIRLEDKGTKPTTSSNHDFTTDIKAKTIDASTLPHIQEPHPGDKNKQKNAVAIVGIGIHLPDAESPDDFWQQLNKGTDVIREVPKKRWDWKKVTSLDSKPVCKYGGFIDDVDHFDAGFFGISPLEAEQMDPQQRLLLQTVWHAIEDAGYSPESMRQTSTGVYIGASTHDYAECLLEAEALLAHGSTGTGQAFLANRLSYMFDLCGPSQTIDTACSSSLVALSQAVTALQQGVCDQAIVGGVNLMLTPTLNRIFSTAGMLSPSGRCRTFSANADGYVRGEGIIAIMLKRIDLSQPIHDNVYAIVKGVSENHGGKANSLTAPNPLSQARVVQRALDQAGIKINSLDLIETHGTGTSLGDPVEVDGLRTVLKNNQATDLSRPIFLGALKTQFGHLEAAAGLASVVKVALSLRHQIMPANLHFDTINPLLKLKGTPFRLLNSKQEWVPSETHKRRAGISSFGIGGSNAHVILEELQYTPSQTDWSVWIIPVSAKTESTLRSLVQNLGKALDDFDNKRLSDISYTLCCGRNHYYHRRAFVVSSIEQLRDLISHDVTQDWTSVQTGLLLSEITPEHSKKQIADTLFTLARDYCSGKSINWQSIPLFENCRRVSLPCYPFAGKPYWAEHKQLDPLVGTLPILEMSGDKLSAQLSIPVNHPLFTHHKVATKEILPGATWIYLLQQFIQLQSMKSGCIKNLCWHLPIFPSDIQDLKSNVVQLSINAVERDTGIELSVVKEDRIYVSAFVISSPDLIEPPNCDIQALYNHCQQTVSIDEFQKALATHGLDYGIGFQAMVNAARSENIAIAKLQLPEVWLQKDVPFHPSIMDGAMQATALLQSTDSVIPNSIPQVPYSIDTIKFYHWNLAHQAIFACVEKTLSDGKPKLNVSLYSEKGKILAKMENLQSRPLGNNNYKPSSNIVMFRPRWFAEQQKSKEKEIPANLLLLERRGHLSRYFKKNHPSCNIRTASLVHDEFIQDHPDYRVDLLRDDSLNELINSYLLDCGWPEQIIHYWSIDEFSREDSDMRTQLDHGVKSLMKLIKLMITHKSDKSIHITYLFPLNNNPLYSAVAAFANTVNAETQAVSLSVIGIEDDDASMIVQEILQKNTGEFHLHNGKRHQRYFEVINGNK